MSRPIPMNGLSRNTPDRLKPFPTVATQKRVVLFDDFLGDVLNANWNVVEGTDSATADAAILATGTGGILRLTTGDAGTGLAADMVQINSALQALAMNGGLEAVVKFKMSAIANAYLFFGFTDTVALEGPVVSAASNNDVTTNASNAVGFMYDTRMGDDNFWLVGVEGDTDATAQDSDVPPVAMADIELRIKVSAQGHASFFIDGIGVGTLMRDAVAPNETLTLTFAAAKVSGASSINVDVDYIGWAMDR